MEIERVFLKPGEYVVSRRPTLVTTLLGSCVAVSLFSPVGKFGCLNHYRLPTAIGGLPPGNFGEFANNALLSFMLKECGSVKGLEAMVFGGACMYEVSNPEGDIGSKNLSLARSFLKHHRIPIIKEVLGQDHGLRIEYQTWNNQVAWRWIESSRP